MSTHKLPRILPMEGALNIRDLGGYPTADGKTTKEGVFFRSDGTDRLTKADVQLLLENRLKAVIDLRGADEVANRPSALASVPELTYTNLPMIDNINSGFTEETFPKSMSELYLRLLNEAKPTIAEIFNCFAKTLSVPEAACLFHCTAGKDRTGTIAMLLLDMAGVDKAHIVADYALTDSLIAPMREAQTAALKAHGINVPDFAFRAAPEDMEITLDFLHSQYAGAYEYLLTCDVKKESLDGIKAAFL